MSRWVCLLLLAALATAEENSDVIELDADNFDDVLDDLSIALVEFYAPWCGHCKRLAPEYEIAATTLTSDDPPIPLAKVDCPANTDLCSRFGVTGYPTLKIFRDGELSGDYNGPRNSDGIVSYMRKQAGPSAKDLPNAETFNKFISNEEPSVIGFFTGENDDLKDNFMSTANRMRDDFRFGLTSDPEVMKEFGYSDQVVIFRPPAMNTKLEEGHAVFGGKDLQRFIEEEFMGLAGVRTRDNSKYFEVKKPLAVAYYDIDYVRNAKGSNYWRNRVLKVAKEFEGKVNFAVSDKEDYSSELQALGLDGGDEAVVVGIYDTKGKYSMSEKFGVDSLRTFVQQYVDGELELYIKSEPVPDNDGPLKVVVGKNFDSIVNDESKDVLIEFYAPWCGHCKALAPKYEELAEKMSGDSNIVIAKSDATANDYPPGFEVRGYPTIYWVPAGSKGKPQKYEGGREVDDFVSFIKKNATNKPVVVAGEEEEEKKKKKKKKQKEDL